jgi:hypothetical protein
MIHRYNSKNEKYEYLELRRKCRIKTIDYIEKKRGGKILTKFYRSLKGCGQIEPRTYKLGSAQVGCSNLTQV